MNDRIKGCKCFSCAPVDEIKGEDIMTWKCSKCNFLAEAINVYVARSDHNYATDRGCCGVLSPVNLEQVELIHSPPHYNKGKFEAIDVMDDWFSDDPLLFTALKYLARCRHKGNLVQDLRKAIWYIERRITKEEENES